RADRQPRQAGAGTASGGTAGGSRKRRQDGGWPKPDAPFPEDPMPTIPQFEPPANLTDFDTIADQRAAWDEFIALSFQRNIEDVEAEVGTGKSHFYNPKVNSTDPPVATDVIRWKGFPLVIAAKHPGNKKAAWAEAEQLQTSGGRTFRPQDEYLEWRVTN